MFFVRLLLALLVARLGHAADQTSQWKVPDSSDDFRVPVSLSLEFLSVPSNQSDCRSKRIALRL